jgi:hypothetical protein
MKATDYPSDVPVPRPYDVDGDKISHSAEYRAQIERLKALGYWPHDTEAHPGGAAFYISLMRALNRLEQAEAEVVTLREAHETLTQENAKHEKYWQEERAGLRERVKFTEPYESVLLQKEQAEAEVVTLRETVQAAEEVVRLREVRLEELAGEVVTLRETLANLVAHWETEAQRIDGFHATMGSGWHSCAKQLAALLAASTEAPTKENA